MGGREVEGLGGKGVRRCECRGKGGTAWKGRGDRSGGAGTVVMRGPGKV